MVSRGRQLWEKIIPMLQNTCRCRGVRLSAGTYRAPGSSTARHGRGDEQVDQRQRQAHLPGRGHHMVIARAQQRGAQRNEAGHEHPGSRRKPDEESCRSRTGLPSRRRTAPPSGDEGHDDAGTYSPTKNMPNFMPGLLGVVTGRQFRLRLGQVEGRAVRHRDAGQGPDEAEELRDDVQCACLLLENDLVETGQPALTRPSKARPMNTS